MSVSDRIWDGLSNVMKMNQRMMDLSDDYRVLLNRMDDLQNRLIQVETTLSLLLGHNPIKMPRKKLPLK